MFLWNGYVGVEKNKAFTCERESIVQLTWSISAENLSGPYHFLPCDGETYNIHASLNPETYESLLWVFWDPNSATVIFAVWSWAIPLLTCNECYIDSRVHLRGLSEGLPKTRHEHCVREWFSFLELLLLLFWQTSQKLSQVLNPINMRSVQKIYSHVIWKIETFLKKTQETLSLDSDSSVPFKVGTSGPHIVLPRATSCSIVFSWISLTV